MKKKRVSAPKKKKTVRTAQKKKSPTTKRPRQVVLSRKKVRKNEKKKIVRKSILVRKANSPAAKKTLKARSVAKKIGEVALPASLFLGAEVNHQHLFFEEEAFEEDRKKPVLSPFLPTPAALSTHVEPSQDTSAYDNIVPNIEESLPVNIVVSDTMHQPSPHVLRLRQVPVPPPVTEVLRTLSWEKRWRLRYTIINEISLASISAFVIWCSTRILRFVFRLPPTTFSLPDFSSLPKDIGYPLARLRALKNLSLDRRQKTWQPAISVSEKAVVEMPVVTVEQAPTPVVTLAPLQPEQANSVPISFLIPRALAFASVAMFLVTPFFGMRALVGLQSVRAAAMDSAQSGLSSFIEGGQLMLASDFTGAADQFNTSRETFARGVAAVEKIPAAFRALATFFPRGGEVNAAKDLLVAAQAFSRAGETFARAGVLFNANNSVSMAERFADFNALAPGLLRDLQTARTALAAVHLDNVPAQYAEQFSEIRRTILPTIDLAVREIQLLQQAIPDLLGFTAPRRYLVLFQNNNEIRATGGFLGSFAVVDVRDGEVQKYTFPGGGTYDLQGSLTKRVAAPEPLQLIADRWEFQDANWWWDWPTSAKKIEWFYDHAGGESVDGVIALDSSAIEQLLEITGPIDIPKYGLTISKENFVHETTAEVETRYDKTENKPKQFLADLAPLLLERLETMSGEDSSAFLSFVAQGFAEKHLQIYRTDAAAQQVVISLGWGGEVVPLPPQTDTLGIVHTNIAGQKTDGVINDTVTHEVNMDADGTLTSNVVITRTHTGVKGDLYTGVRNVNYLRLYVPEGSELVAASGFTPPPTELFKINLLPIDDDVALLDEPFVIDQATGVRISRQFGRTVFGQWIMVDPGQSTTVRVTYRLPWKGTVAKEPSLSTYLNPQPPVFKYAFYWEKQPGSLTTDVSHRFTARQPLQANSATKGIELLPQGWKFEQPLVRDTLLEVKYQYR